MEITNNIKAKVFSQYLGQKYCNKNSPNLIQPIIYGVHGHGVFLSGDYLTPMNGIVIILKPLSTLTDEDAIMCYVITDPRSGFLNENEYHLHRYKNGKDVCSVEITRIDVPDEHLNVTVDGSLIRYENTGINKIIQEKVKNQVQVYQFLQSKGYDLPNYLLGGKTLHEAGLAIYE